MNINTLSHSLLHTPLSHNHTHARAHTRTCASWFDKVSRKKIKRWQWSESVQVAAAWAAAAAAKAVLLDAVKKDRSFAGAGKKDHEAGEGGVGVNQVADAPAAAVQTNVSFQLLLLTLSCPPIVNLLLKTDALEASAGVSLSKKSGLIRTRSNLSNNSQSINCPLIRGAS